MTHISELVPGKGERVITLGGTRAGKSGLQEWTAREIQHERPSAMQLIVDTKPRYRAETERGRFRRGRKNASYRYESWEKGPMVPNSVVMDIWDDKPFKNLFSSDYPAEIVIMQGEDLEDWVRMLALLKGFVNAQIKGRERRIIVDESLDFTSETLLASWLKTMCSIALREQVVNGGSDSILVRTEHTVSRLSFFTWPVVSTSSTCETIKTCDISKIAELPMPNPRKGTISSGSMSYSREEQCQIRSQAGWNCLIRIWRNCRNREGG
jgi:hypothetical protein